MGTVGQAEDAARNASSRLLSWWRRDAEKDIPGYPVYSELVF